MGRRTILCDVALTNMFMRVVVTMMSMAMKVGPAQKQGGMSSVLTSTIQEKILAALMGVYSV